MREKDLVSKTGYGVDISLVDEVFAGRGKA
jgi:hypothetical protein